MSASDHLSAEQFAPLESRLLGKGGERVVNPGYEPDLGKIMDRGQDWEGSPVSFRPMCARNCHGNAAELHVKTGHHIATGYALSDDGLWRQHSWGVHKNTGKPIETTTHRDKYHGVVLNTEEAAQFTRANYP